MTNTADLNQARTTFASDLKRLKAKGIDIHACALLLDLLRDDKLEAFWDFMDGRPELCWRAKPGAGEGRRFKAPDDTVAALFILFLKGKAIVSLPEPQQNLAFKRAPPGKVSQCGN